ncbi:Alpha/Beta hydrolase fold [Sesbania bispinosa]|nr:Alpha/Beta hydrolase fold [Sesbania bispinosa]
MANPRELLQGKGESKVLRGGKPCKVHWVKIPGVAENPLPACYHDCWAAFQWVSSHSTKIPCPNNAETEPWLINDGDFNRVFIVGDSAGGNIAHNIAMRAGTEALPGDVIILRAILTHPKFYRSYPVVSKDQ